jgi:general stress protein 26
MSEAVPVLNREEGIARIGKLIEDIEIAMLTTVSPDGSLHSRPMATQKIPFEGELFFLTGEDSGKVQEVEDDREVALTYVDPKHTFLTLSGRASILNDRTLIEKLWNPTYKAWFPEGKDDPEIRVLRVVVEQAEYWEAPGNALVRNVKILARALTGGKTSVGEHAQVAM